MRRDIFHAIADPTRRAIILLVAIEATTPNSIAEHFETTRQAVSKHLSILTECHLVRLQRSGREIYYELEIEKWKKLTNGLNSSGRYGKAVLLNWMMYY